jgi:hypothetical protein
MKMWNPDQSYAAEQARAAELRAEAMWRREVGSVDTQRALVKWLGRRLQQLGARLEGVQPEKLPRVKQL